MTIVNMVIVIMKWLLFILSNIGTWELLRRETKVHIYFLPSLTIALQVFILFVAGLLNLLQVVTISMWLLGIIYFLLAKKRDAKFLKNYLNAGYLFCALTMIVMLVYVRGKIFVANDNFSHWATVVKCMLETNRYPNFEDTTIGYQTYPLGSATYIYYFSSLIKNSEPIQMLAQIYMMIACIMPVFIFGKKNKVFTFMVVLSFTNFFFVYNTSVTDLLVDTLLPIVSMCALLFTYMYCDNVEKDNQMALYLAALYLIQVIQIKNSGIYFVLLAVIWILYKGKSAKANARRIIPVLFPFISLILWQRHCKYVFTTAENSTHAMTLYHYGSIFIRKSLEDIKIICEAMIKFSVTYKDVWLRFAVLIILGLMIYCGGGQKEYRKLWCKVFIFSLLLYISYQLGMLGMYLFSMPGDEALVLAGSGRYTRTILMAILYIVLLVIVMLASNWDVKKYVTLIMMIIIVILPMIYMQIAFGQIRFVLSQYNPSAARERKWIEQAKIECNVPNGESYCILLSENYFPFPYERELGKYIFSTENTVAYIVEDESVLDTIESKYIFIYDAENVIIQNWIEDHYPEQAGNKVIVREVE